MPPKVSIVTCSHNRPELLRAAIESLRAQTDPNWEHLIYDDASTDKGVLDVLEWARHDPRVRIWRGRENLDRPSVLWNFMLDRAHGRYFTILDDDNQKLPTFVAAMSGELDDGRDLDVVTCGWRVDYAEGGPESPFFLNLSTSAERLLSLSTCDGGAMLYRREIFERAGYFSEDLRTNEDWDWLRRAVGIGQIKNLHEVHSTYLTHKLRRMARANALGNDVDVARVKARRISATLGVHSVFPPTDRLTQSQKDVCAGIASALNTIPWVLANARDLCLVIAPFQRTNGEIADEVQGHKHILSLHMEDSYALTTNLERVHTMAKVADTWVCTNDAACIPYYRKIVGDKIIICPSLSADSTAEVEFTLKRDIDVLLCGYAYPSRKRFVAALMPLLQGLRVTLVGDGWDKYKDSVETLPTQPLVATYALHARARAVVCLHRVHGDCSDGPVEPATVNRGFMEGYLGPRVFLDKTRPFHALDEDDVVWYNGPGDLAGALHRYLAGERALIADRFAEKCHLLYTYRTRLARILNCVRAPRYLAEIP